MLLILQLELIFLPLNSQALSVWGDVNLVTRPLAGKTLKLTSVMYLFKILGKMYVIELLILLNLMSKNVQGTDFI